MTNLITKLNLSIVLILLIYSLAIGQSDPFEPVAPDKIPGILKMIATETKKNFDKIHTWQGEIDVSDYRIDKGEQAKRTFESQTDAVGSCPNEIARISNYTTFFRCNLDKGGFYSAIDGKTPSSYINPINGRDLGTKDSSVFLSYILTNEFYTWSGPSIRSKSTGEVKERSAIKQKVEKSDESCVTCNDYIVYDPRIMFDFQSPPWKAYSKLAKTIEEKGQYINEKGEYEYEGHTLKIEQRIISGDVQYRVSAPARINMQGHGGIMWIIRTHSVDASYNMISYESKFANGPKRQQKNFEYQKINGVFVPIKYTKETFDYNDSSLRHREEQIFKNIQINKDIPAETFTYKNLGLKDGDKFIDKIEKKEYKYENKKLVFVADVNEKPAKPSK